MEKETLALAKEDSLRLLRLLLKHDRSNLYDVLIKIKFELLSVEANEDAVNNGSVH